MIPWKRSVPAEVWKKQELVEKLRTIDYEYDEKYKPVYMMESRRRFPDKGDFSPAFLFEKYSHCSEKFKKIKFYVIR